MAEAFGEYINDVSARRFPAPEHSTAMDSDDLAALLKDVRAAEGKLRRVR
jgi:hypothetical protein